MAQDWHWLTGSCEPDSYELLSYRFFEAGAGSMEELENSTPQATNFRIWFGSLAECSAFRQQFPEVSWETGSEEARDWDLYWRERQTPVQVGPSLWVRPPWVPFEGPQGSVVLELEAKMAFGTGTHESTRLAAEMLEAVNPKGKTVLDIGAGTGILILFAYHKGAKSCCFTEIDPLTLPCLEENYKLNGAGSPRGVLGGLDTFRSTAGFDIIVCNMIRSEVWPLRREIERLLAPGGHLVLSGQLAAEQAPVLEWFQEAGFVVANQAIAQEWWGVLARKEK